MARTGWAAVGSKPRRFVANKTNLPRSLAYIYLIPGLNGFQLICVCHLFVGRITVCKLENKKGLMTEALPFVCLFFSRSFYSRHWTSFSRVAADQERQKKWAALNKWQIIECVRFNWCGDSHSWETLHIMPCWLAAPVYIYIYNIHHDGNLVRWHVRCTRTGSNSPWSTHARTHWL